MLLFCSTQPHRPEMALALADPTQWSLRITANGGLHQFLQGGQKSRLRLGRRLTPATGSAHPRAAQRRTRAQIRQAAADRAPRNAGHLRNSRDPAAPGRTRLARRKEPSVPLVQKWSQCIETSFDAGFVDHTRRVAEDPPASSSFPDSFLAFFRPSRFFPSDSVVQAQSLSGQFLTARAVTPISPAKPGPMPGSSTRARRAWASPSPPRGRTKTCSCVAMSGCCT